jgi:hypothetical protein
MKKVQPWEVQMKKRSTYSGKFKSKVAIAAILITKTCKSGNVLSKWLSL